MEGEELIDPNKREYTQKQLLYMLMDDLTLLREAQKALADEFREFKKQYEQDQKDDDLSKRVSDLEDWKKQSFDRINWTKQLKNSTSWLLALALGLLAFWEKIVSWIK